MTPLIHPPSSISRIRLITLMKYQLHSGSLSGILVGQHSFLVAMSSFIKRSIISLIQRSRVTFSFLRQPHMSFRNCTIFTCNCMLRTCLFTDASAIHMARSRGTLVPHLVRISYSITLLAIVHMYQERNSLYTIFLH